MSISSQKRRRARSIKEIRRRRLGDAYQSPFSRIIYALLNALVYGFAGLLIDLSIVVIRSLSGSGNGDIFWLFAPFMLILGFIIGLVVGKSSGADSMDALPIRQSQHHTHLDDSSIRHDIFRGLGMGITVFAIIWLIMMLIL